MLNSYIVAGFDPARFWAITPRLYVLEMNGALERVRNDRAMVWWGAMMPHLKHPPKLDQFVRPVRQKERMRPEVMQAMCDALAAGWGAERAN